jgi:2-(1,2-epoxy-1,2-dihydrophenyl)acetyl-CoA isomerase
MSGELVQRHDADGVATLRLNRPERRNALSAELMDDLVLQLERVADDAAVRVVVLAANGPSFCVGGDLSIGLDELNGPPPASRQATRLLHYGKAATMLAEMPQPTIAAVHGACAGAGFALALACDLLYASRDAKFTTAYLKAGVSGDFGAAWFATRRLGGGVARRLFLLSEVLSADELERLGAVTHVTEEADPASAALEAAARLAGAAPTALRHLRANLNAAVDAPYEQYIVEEARRHVECAASPEARSAGQRLLGPR